MAWRNYKTGRYRYKGIDFSYVKKRYDKAVLNGPLIECNFMSDYVLVTEYMKRNTGLTAEHLHLLCYLAGFNSTIDWGNIMDYPDKSGRLVCKKKLYEFVDLGLLELFDNNYTNKFIKRQYKLTKYARNIVRKYNSLMFKFEQIPIQANYSDEEFVTKPTYRHGVHSINWYACIVKFNEIVKKNKKKSKKI